MENSTIRLLSIFCQSLPKWALKYVLGHLGCNLSNANVYHYKLFKVLWASVSLLHNVKCRWDDLSVFQNQSGLNAMYFSFWLVCLLISPALSYTCCGHFCQVFFVQGVSFLMLHDILTFYSSFKVLLKSQFLQWPFPVCMCVGGGKGRGTVHICWALCQRCKDEWDRLGSVFCPS